MPKKSISSLELHAIVQELQILVKGKVSQIYHQNKSELLLQLHAPGKGKQLLKIIPGKLICFTKNKETALRPSSFCMQLRKYINNAFIKLIEQKDSERIIIFTLERKETYYLIIELFSKGNIILTNKDNMIITSVERQIWKDRMVKPNVQYKFPEPTINWKKISEKELTKIISESDRKTIVTTLATRIGLGGVYAEEVCARANIDKNKEPKDVTKQEITTIHQTIQKIISLSNDPKGNMYAEDITPFPLHEQKPTKVTASYSAALDTVNPFSIMSPYDKKIKALQRMIEEQEESIKKQQQRIEVNTNKGEEIYNKYIPLQKLINIVTELRKTKTWQEVQEELKKEKKIKKIDLKNKKVIISL